MKKCIYFLSVIVMLASVYSANSQTLVHYWNFNDPTNVSTLLAPYSVVNGASIVHVQGGISAIDVQGGTGQNFNVQNLNARFGDASGNHLRFNDPIGGGLVFSLPTTGFKDVVIKYATRRSGSGAGFQIVEYTTDGTNYTVLDTILPNNGDPALVTLDFSAITAVNNNANFKLRYTFAAGSGGTVGNNRFDNFSVEGNSEGGDNLPPVVTFIPTLNSTDVALNVKPTITFNENIRLLNNTAIDNSNVNSVITFKLNNQSGQDVAFTASITDKVITVSPVNELMNGQQYYLAIKANAVEDLSDNALSSAQFTQFTTVTVQTIFNSGDIIPVAYRMNATATDDEIALLTLVNILPGTKINITDAKYTDNVPAQCSGGIVWTAPMTGVAAGTVIQIKNDNGTANIGTVTGSNFGLSSGGDQFIIYTGTPENPNYITALSSNIWLQNNNVCNGSLSKIPASLSDGINSINMSTAPGNTGGNTVNAFYNGPQDLPYSQLRTSVLNPANWVGTGSGTPAQVWPVWGVQGPPSVIAAEVINQTTIRVIFNRDLDAVSSTNTANFTGIPNLQSVTRTNNGNLKDTLTLNYSIPFAAGIQQILNVQNVKDINNVSMTGTYTFSFNYQTKISFEKVFIVTEENSGIYNLVLKLENPSAASVNLVLKPAPFSTAVQNQDFIFNTQTINFNANSSLNQIISIPITDDMLSEDDEYFVLSLENPNGLTINGFNSATIYIRDNDKKVVAPKDELTLKYTGSFEPNSVQGSTTEIVSYDYSTKRIYMTSAIQDRMDIADFSNPANVQLIKSIDMTPYGGITSVTCFNGLVAVASPNADETLPGSVVFFDADGNFLKQVTVGSLPDMATFTHDGKKVLTANEGQPNDAYTIDPEGSVSIIDLSGGIGNLSQNNVTTLLFTQYNAQEAQLIASGVRKLKKTSTLSQDFEPEYITVSADDSKAWVTLQENNAIAEINLTNNTYTSLWALGTKDGKITGNGFDASDNNNEILIANWPVKSFYIPDGTANITYNGITYLLTANEGDEKEYAGLGERTTVGASNYNLDPAVYPNAAILKQSYNLGRFRVTNLNGDENGDGLFEQIYSNGARSFSIWNTSTKSLVWDSGNDFEQIISKDPAFKAVFNADNEGSAVAKARSRAKGPEPEGVTTGKIGNQMYAFVSLERVGGVMAYNITNPNQPYFAGYNNSRIVTNNGDLAPEGIVFINWDNSPNGKNYVLVANEISGTVTIYQVITKPTLNIADANVCKGTQTELGKMLNGNPVSVVNGSGDYSYNWTPSSGLLNANSYNPTVINPAFNQTYTLVVKDNQTGLTSTGTAKVNIYGEPKLNLPVLIKHPKNTLLDLSTLTVGNITEGLAPYSVVWSNLNGIIADPQIIPAIGANRYFATVIDTRGCVSATKSVTIYVSPAKEAVEEDLAIGMNGEIIIETYPNPVTDKFTANIEIGNNESAVVRISDMTGSEIRTLNFNSQQFSSEIMMSTLPSGVYFMTVETATDKAVKKIVKK